MSILNKMIHKDFTWDLLLLGAKIIYDMRWLA